MTANFSVTDATQTSFPESSHAVAALVLSHTHTTKMDSPPLGSSAFYRQRFESSVFGLHTMQPPPEVAARFVSAESPSKVPCGQDTSFSNATPMPFRFTDDAVPVVNQRLTQSIGKPSPPPQYMTSSSEVGKLGISETDLPMRWYGRAGAFTSSWVAPPKTRVSTGLNTAFDHSNVHPTADQGWSGHLGLTDYNVANLSAASFVGKAPRTAM